MAKKPVSPEQQERSRASQKRWRDEHREQRHACNKRWTEENRERVNEMQRKRYRAQKELKRAAAESGGVDRP